MTVPTFAENRTYKKVDIESQAENLTAALSTLHSTLKGVFKMDCLFCKIVKGNIPSKKVYEDESVFAFWDIAPMAPVHVLIVPKMHISSVNEVTSENSAVISHIYEVAAQLAKELGVAEDGYRIVTNCGKNAGQTVFHLHFHLLGGTALKVEMC